MQVIQVDKQSKLILNYLSLLTLGDKKPIFKEEVFFEEVSKLKTFFKLNKEESLEKKICEIKFFFQTVKKIELESIFFLFLIKDLDEENKENSPNDDFKVVKFLINNLKDITEEALKAKKTINSEIKKLFKIDKLIEKEFSNYQEESWLTKGFTRLWAEKLTYSKDPEEIIDFLNNKWKNLDGSSLYKRFEFASWLSFMSEKTTKETFAFLLEDNENKKTVLLEKMLEMSKDFFYEIEPKYQELNFFLEVIDFLSVDNYLNHNIFEEDFSLIKQWKEELNSSKDKKKSFLNLCEKDFSRLLTDHEINFDSIENKIKLMNGKKKKNLLTKAQLKEKRVNYFLQRVKKTQRQDFFHQLSLLIQKTSSNFLQKEQILASL